MRGRSWRLGRTVVAVAFVAAAAALVGTFTATRSASHAPFVFTKGDPDSSIKTKAGIANEGPDGSLAAQLEAQRAYPADSVPAAATANSQATFAALSTARQGAGRLGIDRPEPGQVPGRARPVPRRRQAVHGFGPRHRARDRRLQEGGQVLPLPRCGRRRRVGGRQGDRRGRQRALAVQVRLVRRRTRSARCSSIRRDPTGNTVYAGTGEPNASGDSEAGVGIYKSTDGGDTWTLVPGQRHLQGSRGRRRSRSTGPATCSSASPARSAASAPSPAARSAARRRPRWCRRAACTGGSRAARGRCFGRPTSAARRRSPSIRTTRTSSTSRRSPRASGARSTTARRGRRSRRR